MNDKDTHPAPSHSNEGLESRRLRSRLLDAALFLPLPLIIMIPRVYLAVGIYLLLLFALQIALLFLRGQTIGLRRNKLHFISTETNEKAPFIFICMRYGFGMTRLLTILGIGPGKLSQTQLVSVEPK